MERVAVMNFSELYDRTIDSLFAFGMAYTSDRELIKDCIQDVFVKLFKKRKQLDCVVNIDSYLLVSLKNRINDEFRHNSRLCDMRIDDDSMNFLDDVSDKEYIEEQNSRFKLVSEHIKCLSPRQRQIISLYYIDRRKYEDICKIMGINYQSVRNLMHRSLQKLRCMATKTNKTHSSLFYN